MGIFHQHRQLLKSLGFLRRNLAFSPRHTKEVAYKTLVCPKLEYAAPIWHPYHETQNGQVKKVQRTAARWTCRRWRNTRRVGDMPDELEWPSLETHRIFLRAGRDDVTTGKLFPSRGECLGLYRCVLIIFKRK